MRNPWVHDEMPEGAGYSGHVRLLATLAWGTLTVGVGGFMLLSGTGVVDPSVGQSAASVLSYVVTAVAAALLSPLVLRLILISRLLATVVFLGGSWGLGRFLWTRESDRIERLLTDGERVGAGTESVDKLIEVVDVVFAVVTAAA